MRISHEAIYQVLYVQGRGALWRELSANLRTGRALRVPWARVRGRGKSFVTSEILIRPADQRRPSSPRMGLCDSMSKISLPGVIIAPTGEAIPGPKVAWRGRKHGPRQQRRWATSTSRYNLVAGGGAFAMLIMLWMASLRAPRGRVRVSSGRLMLQPTEN
jgi:hypothetical protein